MTQATFLVPCTVAGFAIPARRPKSAKNFNSSKAYAYGNTRVPCGTTFGSFARVFATNSVEPDARAAEKRTH
eukprot:2334794-Rhodomonas_salina.1